jgi:hypothetical protein
VLFSPDGRTLLLSQGEADKVAVFRVDAGSLVKTEDITRIGLAVQMAMVGRGTLSGTVLLPSVDAHGNIAQLRIAGPGDADDLGQLELGSGFTNIPDGIAIQP